MRHSGAFPACGVLLMLIILSPAAAETVMLYSDRPSGIGDETSAIHYIEDGIMEIFFDAGHIIFNGTYGMMEGDESGDSPFDDNPVYRIAKSGGASYVLSVRLSFTEDMEELLPVSAAYEFIELLTERHLSSGTVLLERSDGWKEKEPYELVQNMGRKLGREALEGL